MAEQDSAPGNGWGHHNLKTTADVERMLKGLPPLTEQEGEAIPPTPALPDGAVSATVETVDAQPMRTVETVEVIDDGSRTVISPAVPKRRR